MGMRTAPETNASAPGWSITYGAQNPQVGGVNMDKAGLGFNSLGSPVLRDVNNAVVWEAGVQSASAVTKTPVTVRVALAAADTAGGVLAWANPTGGSIIATRVVFDVTTKATGACTIDVGVAADGTTSADTVMDGLDVGTAAGVFDNIENQGTNGKSALKLTSSQYITASRTGGAAAGLVGYAYITYHPI